jgi:hypothetical protein
MNNMKFLRLNILLLSTILFAAAADSARSQTVHVLEVRSTNGDPTGEKTTFEYDPFKDNSVHVLVRFPKPFGKNRIAFQGKKVGESTVRGAADIKPSATWFSYELFLPQWGEYTIQVVDTNENKVIAEKVITLVLKGVSNSATATTDLASATLPASEKTGDTVNTLRGWIGR